MLQTQSLLLAWVELAAQALLAGAALRLAYVLTRTVDEFKRRDRS